MTNDIKNINSPYIDSETSLPEITIKSVIIGVILAVIFAISSLYIGLKFARTIAASIPAALLSLLIFKAFKKSHIFENVIVQTIASAGESVAAMAAFCITALVLSGYWQEFEYLSIMLMLGLGGVLGVFISVPLRKIMIVEGKLPYPEGVAVAEMLISGEGKNNATRLLLKGSFISIFVTFLQNGLKIGSDFIQYGTKVFTSVVGGNIMLSPLSLGAGYIIGMSNCTIMLIGALVANILVIPILGFVYISDVNSDAISIISTLQKQYLRYIGVGIMIAGALWSLLSIAPAIKNVLNLGISGLKPAIKNKSTRTEYDIPIVISLIGILLIALCIGMLFYSFLASTTITFGYKITIVAFCSLMVIFLGFIMAAVSSQLVGILGTTSLPVSGLSLATVIIFASLISPLFLTGSDSHTVAITAVGFTLVFTAVVGSVLCLGGDNMQDLKTGYIIGSTPWKQQVVLIIGIIVSAIAIPFMLQTMFEAYGIGDILPRSEMDPTKALSAPQGMLIASVTKGMFTGQLSWAMVTLGIGMAVVVIVIDKLLVRYCSLKLPVMTFAAGFYLPIGISIAFFFGGLLNKLLTHHNDTASLKENGVMIASGLIAGEAITGALLSIPFALYQDTNIFALNIGMSIFLQDILGIALFISTAMFFLVMAMKKLK